MVYNVTWYVGLALHQSLLIFNVHYISLVNIRPIVGSSPRLSVSLMLSLLHIKIGSTNKISSFSYSIVHGKLEVKWREIFSAVLSFSYTFTQRHKVMFKCELQKLPSREIVLKLQLCKNIWWNIKPKVAFFPHVTLFERWNIILWFMLELKSREIALWWHNV